MKKTLIVGVSAVATGGLIIGGILAFDRSDDLRNAIGEKPAENAAQDDQQKIKDLVWEEWQDTKKYSFCLGEAKINNDYADPILNNSGTLEHISRELLVFNKESNKLQIAAREIDYKYKGTINAQMGGLSASIPVSELGSLKESYSKNEMPIRIDYANKYVFTNPDVKKSQWVKSVIGEDTEMVDPHIGCAGDYKLDNSPGQDVLVGSENILIDRKCNEKDINGNYAGEFVYQCTAIDYLQAKEWYDGINAKQDLQSAKDVSMPENNEEAVQAEKADGSTGARGDTDSKKAVDNELREAIESVDEVAPDNEEIKKQLEQFKEIQADQSVR